MAAAGAVMMPQYACKQATASAAEVASSTSAKGSLDAYGIQLYTLRDVIGDDPKGTLEKLGKMGFTQVEGYDGPKGMFWDMGHKDYASFLADNGMKMVSCHVNINEGFEEKAAQSAEIGMDYIICPYIGPQKSKDDWKKVCDRFNELGAVAKKNGIQFAYHNHAYSFKPFSGMIPHDYLMDNTDPDLVAHEMDIYWVVTGGADPKEYLKKYSNRFRLCHVKDRMANTDEQGASCNLGTGVIDFPSILKVAKDNGMEYFIMEQERYDDSTPMKSAEVGAKYMDSLVFA